jgi:hypothetical protein
VLENVLPGKPKLRKSVKKHHKRHAFLGTLTFYDMQFTTVANNVRVRKLIGRITRVVHGIPWVAFVLAPFIFSLEYRAR